MISRGIKDRVDRFVEDMSAQYFPIEMNGKKIYVQLAMRPLQLWEVVFPEPCLQEVMNTIWDSNVPIKEQQFPYKLRLGALRKLLRAKKLPALDKSGLKRIVRRDFVSCYPIGIKGDKYDENNKCESL